MIEDRPDIRSFRSFRPLHARAKEVEAARPILLFGPVTSRDRLIKSAVGIFGRILALVEHACASLLLERRACRPARRRGIGLCSTVRVRQRRVER